MRENNLEKKKRRINNYYRSACREGEISRN